MKSQDDIFGFVSLKHLHKKKLGHYRGIPNLLKSLNNLIKKNTVETKEKNVP